MQESKREIYMKRSSRPEAKKLDSVMITILVVVIMAFLVRFFLLDAAVVEGKSMLPHYRNGQVVLILNQLFMVKIFSEVNLVILKKMILKEKFYMLF